MDQDLTTEQMAEILYGKEARPQVEFYMSEVRDDVASAEQGKRVMVPFPFIHLVISKENVDVRRLATGEDVAKFREEWLAFQESRKPRPVEATRHMGI